MVGQIDQEGAWGGGGGEQKQSGGPGGGTSKDAGRVRVP